MFCMPIKILQSDLIPKMVFYYKCRSGAPVLNFFSSLTSKHGHDVGYIPFCFNGWAQDFFQEMCHSLKTAWGHFQSSIIVG